MQPTQPLLKAIRRLPLTTKQGPHNYYKGNRTGAMGHHKGRKYIIDLHKVRTYVCPDLSDFQLTPFVEERMSKNSDKFGSAGPMDGKNYIRTWKAMGGNM